MGGRGILLPFATPRERSTKSCEVLALPEPDNECATWRPMAAADIAAVSALADHVHPLYPERRAVLEEKLRLFPGGCFVLVRQDGSGQEHVAGYCFSHPWVEGAPPALDTFLGALPERPTTTFIHDMTLGASARGQGQALALVPRLVAMTKAQGFRRIALVAVNGSEPFWQRAGFERLADDGVQAEARKRYGDGAVAMARML